VTNFAGTLSGKARSQSVAFQHIARSGNRDTHRVGDGPSAADTVLGDGEQRAVARPDLGDAASHRPRKQVVHLDIWIESRDERVEVARVVRGQVRSHHVVCAGHGGW
jgi:hypothetical protein